MVPHNDDSLVHHADDSLDQYSVDTWISIARYCGEPKNRHCGEPKCHHCGEPETACLKFYPHDREIRFKSKRLGLNEESRKEVVNLIEKSKIVCSNCYIKYEHDIIDIM